jgi:putative membrane protein insertion efficiency factor
LISRFLVVLVRAYQVVLSPLLPGSCKYHPSCSRYAIDALREYGALRGSILAGWRILRCNPFSHGGHDPVAQQRVFRSRPDQGAGVQIAGRGPGSDPQ